MSVALRSNKLKEQNGLLVWLFPTMTELMSGELIASAKALVTALTGEGFLTFPKG